VIDPDVCAGLPRIAGTRVRVIDIVEVYNRGRSPAEILDSYEFLTLGQIHAALAYYYDHKAEVDAEIAGDMKWEDEFRRQNPGSVR
jgi:uncharacterized protein (DUF433 family)